MQYSVKFPDGTDTSNVRIRTKTPETVNFMVSTQTKKVVPVAGSFEGSVAEGFTAEAPEFEPSTITIYGPETYLKSISRAWVNFGSQEIDSTYSVNTGYVLHDDEGNECSTTGLSFSDDTVKATIRILEVKEIPLAVNLIPGAGASEDNAKVTIEPKSITLAGDSAVLSSINRIPLATIDLTDFSSTYSDTYLIKFDDGLTNLSGTTEASVKIELAGLETRDFSVSRDNMSYINVTDGYSVDILSESLKVTLRGTPEQLQDVRSDNIRVVADLKDYNTTTGQILPEVKIQVDGFTDVGAVGKYTINIIIKKG